MAGERVKIVVRERESRGSADSRRLRKQGLIPGVLYGRGEPLAFTVAERELRSALTGEAGLHAILDVTVDGKDASHASVVKDYQQHVVRGNVTHIDLHEVRLDQPIQSVVAVHLVGEAAGSREGGVLSQALNEVNIEALPLEVPSQIELDISGLHVGDSIRVADLQAPSGVTILDDPETTIASVTLPMREELEGAEAAEGESVPAEQQPEGASEAPAEPDADAAGEHQTTEG
jgi:large subunit ribosomal protein L25